MNLVKIVILVNMVILMVLVNSGDSCKLGDSVNSRESVDFSDYCDSGGFGLFWCIW